jgi:hypothetical protein
MARLSAAVLDEVESRSSGQGLLQRLEERVVRGLHDEPVVTHLF